MNRKSLKDCESFFVDSGILIDLLKTDLSSCTQQVKDRIEIVNNFFSSLFNPEIYGNGKKYFQLSSITIAEIFHIDNLNDDTLNAIIKVLNSQNVEVCSFDYATAIFHNKEFYSYLSNKEIDIIRNATKDGLYANTKEKVRKDFLIAATAKLYKSDVVLTNDNGFHEICKRIDIFSHLFTEDNKRFLTSGHGKLIYDFA